MRAWNSVAALPLSSPACATRSSRLPYCCSHLTAVFGPTPGTPGRLSLDSPTSAARSGYIAGVAKYFSSTVAGVIRARSDTPLRG